MADPIEYAEYLISWRPQHCRVNAQEAELKRSITALSSEHNQVKLQIRARRCMRKRMCASVGVRA